MSRTSNHDLGTQLVGDGASASCRLDWLSVSLFGGTSKLQREQLSYFFSLIHAVADGATWAEPSQAKFFDHACSHPAGLGIKWTEPDSGNTNAGLISVDVKGTAFRALDRETRKALYLDIGEMEGFKACTRLDAQRTVLNPIASAEEIYESLLLRRRWIKGYRSFTQLGPVDVDGTPADGATVMWGSPTSSTRARTYNKSAESGWSTPAVRHEVQLRKQPARDKFNALIQQLQVEQADDVTSVENAFVQQVLNQHMAYLDTTRLAKIKRKDWPKNWAKQCKKADFWEEEVVSGNPDEIKTIWRLEKRLEESVAHSDAQYGRTLAKWMLKAVHADGLDPQEALMVRSAQWMLRLKDEDLEELLQLVPKEHHDALIRNFDEWRKTAAHNAEQIPS